MNQSFKFTYEQGFGDQAVDKSRFILVLHCWVTFLKKCHCCKKWDELFSVQLGHIGQLSDKRWVGISDGGPVSDYKTGDWANIRHLNTKKTKKEASMHLLEYGQSPWYEDGSRQRHLVMGQATL